MYELWVSFSVREEGNMHVSEGRIFWNCSKACLAYNIDDSDHPLFKTNHFHIIVTIAEWLYFFLISTKDSGQKPFTFQVGLGKVIAG